MANFNFNKVILGGRLTADPELKKTQNGDISVCSFTVAVNRRFSRAGEQPQADFINCVAWRQQAELLAKYFRKGSSVCVVGSIQTRSWTDNQGAKRYATEVIVDEIQFVDSKGDGSSREFPTDAAPQTPAYSTLDAGETKFEEVDDDDLPF
jgi:single-strand DNA-binding protein